MPTKNRKISKTFENTLNIKKPNFQQSQQRNSDDGNKKKSQNFISINASKESSAPDYRAKNFAENLIYSRNGAALNLMAKLRVPEYFLEFVG